MKECSSYKGVTIRIQIIELLIAAIQTAVAFRIEPSANVNKHFKHSLQIRGHYWYWFTNIHSNLPPLFISACSSLIWPQLKIAGLSGVGHIWSLSVTYMSHRFVMFLRDLWVQTLLIFKITHKQWTSLDRKIKKADV